MKQVVTACAAILALACAAPALAFPTVGKAAPDFTVTTFDGKKIALKDLKGQVVVLNFWATWCGPCKRELPLLDTYYKLQKRFGLTVVAVTTEDSVDPWRLKPLQDILTMRLARSYHGGYPPPEAVPMNYVIDRAGVLRYAKAAAFDLDALNGILVPLLKEAPPETDAPATPAASQVSASPASGPATTASTLASQPAR